MNLAMEVIKKLWKKLIRYKVKSKIYREVLKIDSNNIFILIITIWKI